MDLESQIRHVHGPEEVTYGLDELVVVCLVRDGRPYLTSFVEHYLSLGVKHIVFLDNGSSDDTVSAAQSYDNVTILRTDLPFKDYKNDMRRYLITRFGWGRWILYVDIDELFDYPYSDVVSLSSFLRYLTKKSYTAVVAQMLNMFPEKPVLNAATRKDEPLKELHRFYDISNIRTQDYSSHNTLHQLSNTQVSDEIEVYRDGINRTLFGHRSLLTKHPLMFVDHDMRPLFGSEHWVGGARIADITCALFHYKFIGDFYKRAVRAVEEESYARNSRKYKMLLDTMEQNPELRIKLDTARELRNVDDLVDNQFLVVSGDYMTWVDAEERKSGTVASLQAGELRRLVEAFSKASARARTEAKRIQNLEHQVEELEKSLAKRDRRIKILERKAKNLERQTRYIQGSGSWKLLLEKLGRIRARMSGKV
jgi:hypothetical protein